MGSKDYYNVVIYNTKDGKPEGVQLKALSEVEVRKYFDHVKNREFGLQPIGNRKEKIVSPDGFQIFDFSKMPSLKGRNKSVFRKTIEKKAKSVGDFLKACEELGHETDSFKIKLEDILSRSPEDNSGVDSQEKSPSAQNKMEAETGEFDLSGSNMKGQVISGSTVQGNLTGKASPILPREFEKEILDAAVDPAFNVEKIASVFANHLKNLRNENGQMIGVFGQWGRGKSYFVKQVYKQLEEKYDDGSPFVNVKFQVWKYQSTPSIWAYLFETFIKEYLDVNWWDKIWRIIHLSTERNGNWKTWGKPLTILILGFLLILLIPSLLEFVPFFKENEIYGKTIQLLGGAGAVSFIIARINSFIKFAKEPALHLFNSLSKIPSFKHVLGIQEEIHKELISLIKAWKNYLNEKRILLFIDDLDRCSHDSLIKIVDSLRVMLDDEEINKHILVLMAVDEDKLQRVVRIKYDNLYKEDDDLKTIAIEYLDKLFISAIKLYPISDDERAEFINKIAKQINVKEADNTQTDKKEEGEVEGEEKDKTEDTSEPKNETDDSDSTEGSKSEDEQEAEKGVPPGSTETKEETEPRKNLDETEIKALTEKIKITNKEIKLTPRQIRIVVYRYLLARNLWLVFYGNLNWKADDAINEIMRLSGFTNEEPNDETKVFGGLYKICQMVVAY